jgi:hypothetical protein
VVVVVVVLAQEIFYVSPVLCLSELRKSGSVCIYIYLYIYMYIYVYIYIHTYIHIDHVLHPSCFPENWA